MNYRFYIDARMSDYIETLHKTRKILGSYSAIGNICGISGRAVQKWVEKKRPPRTEYTGETQYAKKLEAATNGQVKSHELMPDRSNNC
jgi:DNA-binding transcriptional regulator YdaS (Cro superfamily)